MRLFRLAAMTAALIGFAGSAQAHGFHADEVALGFTHPFIGLDHLLAMVTVGLWAAQRGGRALWALPVVFVLGTGLGGLVALDGIALPAVELTVTLSLVMLGGLVALSAKPALPVGAAIVGLFALFHGHAHGTELPAAVSPLMFGLGMVGATALLHLIGIGAFRTVDIDKLVRAAGAAVSAAGLAMLAA